jgi:hypothetical protein
MRILLSSLSLSLLLHPLTAFGYAGFSVAAKVIRKALRKSAREGLNSKRLLALFSSLFFSGWKLVLGY